MKKLTLKDFVVTSFTTNAKHILKGGEALTVDKVCPETVALFSCYRGCTFDC